MKKIQNQTLKHRRIALRRETLLNLTADRLERVVGGYHTYPQSEQVSCTKDDACTATCE
jgi:hypothetical protein